MHQMNNISLDITKDGIILFYFRISDKFNNKTIQSLISTISVSEQKYFTSIQNKSALKRTLFGRIILKYIASGLGIARPEYVSSTISGKPVFTPPNGIDFNISHSGDMVVCCLAEDAFIGIDIELIRPVNIEIYRNCFDSQEWQFITESENPELAFLKLWVRKEAVIKADSWGIEIDLSSFNCLNNIVKVVSNNYYIQDIVLDDEYTCAIACSKRKTIKLKDFNEIFLTEYEIDFNTRSIHQAYGKV
jgi:4'-phosphopantetheinyl transferase